MVLIDVVLIAVVRFIVFLIIVLLIVVLLIVLCLAVEFLCCWHLMRVFIFLVRFGYLNGHLLGNSCLIGLRYVFLV